MRSAHLNDRLAAGVLVAATFAYLASLPRYLGWADESYFLYEAKRIRDGEVMYRDVFQFITPLATYCMAILYWLFGTSIATARLAMAVLHALLCAILFATCRAIGVRRSLALLVPLAFLSLCQGVWPFASPHWFSTVLAMAILAVLCTGERDQHPRRTLVLGVLLGILIGVQQQKGAIMAAGVGAIVLGEHVLDRHKRNWMALCARIGWLAAGVLTVVLPLGLWMIASAGSGPVYEALVRFPLESYRRGHFARWGEAAPLTDSFAAATFPALLRWSPVAVLPPVARLLHAVIRGGIDRTSSVLMALAVFAAASVASIWYFPDLIHIAFIAPAFFICAAETGEWLLRRFARSSGGRVLGGGTAMVVAAILGYQLWRNTATMAQQFTLPHDTAFGRIDFAQPWEPLFVDGVRALLDEVPGRELFSYPNVTSIYLTAGARNPTPYQYLLARVSPPTQIAKAQAILDARRLPYVVVSPVIFTARDPLATFITTHYESAPIQSIVDAGELPAYWLYRRKQ